MYSKLLALALAGTATASAFSGTNPGPLTIQAKFQVGSHGRWTSFKLRSFQLCQTLTPQPCPVVASKLSLALDQDCEAQSAILQALKCDECVNITLCLSYACGTTTTIVADGLGHAQNSAASWDGGGGCDSVCFSLACVSFAPAARPVKGGPGAFDVSFYDTTDPVAHPVTWFQDYPDFCAEGLTGFPDLSSPTPMASLFLERAWLGDTWLNALLAAEAGDPYDYDQCLPPVFAQVTPTVLETVGGYSSNDVPDSIYGNTAAFYGLATESGVTLCATDKGSAKETVWLSVPPLGFSLLTGI